VDLHTALGDALARLLLTEEGRVAVTDGDRYLGTLSPAMIHHALRASTREP
jgi:hypothetical protein